MRSWAPQKRADLEDQLARLRLQMTEVEPGSVVEEALLKQAADLQGKIAQLNALIASFPQ